MIAAGTAAYLITKKKKEEVTEEVKIIKILEGEKETNQIKDIAEKYSLEVTELNIKYPYLKPKFINETIEFAQNFSIEYPNGMSIRINHVARFERVEDLIEFVKIVKENDYAIQEAQEENTILASLECTVAGSNITEDVFSIANQVYCLQGEYLGFRIDRL